MREDTFSLDGAHLPSVDGYIDHHPRANIIFLDIIGLLYIHARAESLPKPVLTLLILILGIISLAEANET